MRENALFGASTRCATKQNRAALLSTLGQFSVSGLEISLLDGALLAEYPIKGRIPSIRHGECTPKIDTQSHSLRSPEGLLPVGKWQF